jgi:hypothetical protein
MMNQVILPAKRVECVLIVETARNMDVSDDREKDSLVSILREADAAGLTSKVQHHEVAIRYSMSMDEFISCTDVLIRSGYFDEREYGLASMAHAAKKARNYISRHSQPKTDG